MLPSAADRSTPMRMMAARMRTTRGSRPPRVRAIRECGDDCTARSRLLNAAHGMPSRERGESFPAPTRVLENGYPVGTVAATSTDASIVHDQSNWSTQDAAWPGHGKPGICSTADLRTADRSFRLYLGAGSASGTLDRYVSFGTQPCVFRYLPVPHGHTARERVLSGTNAPDFVKGAAWR